MKVRLIPSFPLLGKELIEQAARKRTYVIRVVYAVLLFAIFLLMYAEITQLTANRGPETLYFLGSGRMLFQFVVGLQFTGIFLFLPAMISGVITYEKERQSLPLLLLTGLTPTTILIEKFLGRLIPMGTFLLLSLPLMAVCYMLGGVTLDAFVAAVYFLFLTCLQVGMLALMFSSWCRTSVQAFVTTYLVGTAFYFALPLGQVFLDSMGISLHFSDEVVFSLIPAYLFGDLSRTPLSGEIIVRSLPIWVSIVVFAFLARFFLVRQAFVPAKDRALQLFRWIDRLMQSVNRRIGGIMLVKSRGSLPDDEPVAWRETSRRLLGKPQYLVRLAILVEVPILLLAFALITGDLGYGGQMEGLSAVVLGIWILAVLTVTVQSGNTIVSERVRGTLDVLATTPMRGEAILRQKMRGLTRVMIAFAVPLLTVVLVEAWWESTATHAWYSRRSIDPFTYVLGTVLVLAIYLPLFAWGALWISLRARTRARAIIQALSVLVIWVVAPPLMLAVTDSFLWDVDDPPAVYLLLLSPATIVFGLEFSAFNEIFEGDPIVIIAVNCFFYWLLLRGLRNRCLRDVDRHLGRASLRPRPG